MSIGMRIEVECADNQVVTSKKSKDSMRIILFMKSESIKPAKIANLFDLWTMNLVFQFNEADETKFPDGKCACAFFFYTDYPHIHVKLYVSILVDNDAW